jgi:hypothetical protein
MSLKPKLPKLLGHLTALHCVQEQVVLQNAPPAKMNANPIAVASIESPQFLRVENE